MKKKVKPESFIQQPPYPGGKRAMDEFIRSSMKYPDEALKNNVQGSVHIKYDTDVFGVVISASVIHGIGYGCDEEALRLVKLLKFEKKKYRGLHVTFHRKIFINFHLPAKPVPSQQEIVIQYHYMESK